MATDPRLVRTIPRVATPPQPPPPPPPLSQHDGTDDGVVDPARKEDGGFKLKFCTVCASNQNRYVGAGVVVSFFGVKGFKRISYKSFKYIANERQQCQPCI